MKARRKRKTGKAARGRRQTTAAQIAARVEQLLRIRIDGAEVWDCCEYMRQKVAEKDPVWGKEQLSKSQIYRYLSKVDELIAESCKTGRKRLFRRHLAQRRNLYARAVNSADYSAALRCLRDEAELLNLYPRPEDELRRDVENLKKQLAAMEKADGNSNPPGGNRPAETVDRRAGGADVPAGQPVAG